MSKTVLHVVFLNVLCVSERAWKSTKTADTMSTFMILESRNQLMPSRVQMAGRLEHVPNTLTALCTLTFLLEIMKMLSFGAACGTRQKMNAIEGGSIPVYKSQDATLWTEIVAIFTMSTLFFIMIFYMIIVPGLVYYTVTFHSWLGLAIAVIVSSSVWWAREKCNAVSDSFVFEAWRRYFQFTVYREQVRFPRGKNILFTVVPHGVFPLALPMLSGVCSHVLSELDTQIPITAVASNMFYIPIVTPLLIWLGCISATEEHIRDALKRETCIIVPDGIAGIFHSDPLVEKLYIRKRRGFVKIAIQAGSSLVPMYCFGHTQVFTRFAGLDFILTPLSRRLGFSIIFFKGYSLLPSLPRRVQMTVVIGSVFQPPKCANPSDELVEHVLNQYIEHIEALFEKHKHVMIGGASRQLEIY